MCYSLCIYLLFCSFSCHLSFSLIIDVDHVVMALSLFSSKKLFFLSLWPEFVGMQDGSMWLFTTEKFEGSRPCTVQVKYEGFAEGI